HGLTVNLLADVDGKVCEKYRVWQEKEKDGVKKMCMQRSTFLIDRDGVLRHMQYGVNPKGHAHEILKLIKEL
ncbi:MAG: redoxin domain-containing protein, partial [Methylobacterium sp.]|nr:redoxin domain-containing protein [Methylobacterium sp.]